MTAGTDFILHHICRGHAASFDVFLDATPLCCGPYVRGIKRLIVGKIEKLANPVFEVTVLTSAA